MIIVLRGHAPVDPERPPYILTTPPLAEQVVPTPTAVAFMFGTDETQQKRTVVWRAEAADQVLWGGYRSMADSTPDIPPPEDREPVLAALRRMKAAFRRSTGEHGLEYDVPMKLREWVGLPDGTDCIVCRMQEPSPMQPEDVVLELWVPEGASSPKLFGDSYPVPLAWMESLLVVLGPDEPEVDPGIILPELTGVTRSIARRSATRADGPTPAAAVPETSQAHATLNLDLDASAATGGEGNVTES